MKLLNNSFKIASGLALVAATLLGCSRPVNQKSVVRITAPKSLSTRAAAGGPVEAAAVSWNKRKTCYGVNVTGGGISLTPPLTCTPQILGTLAGLAESGQVIEADVPPNASVNIEAYAYLQPEGQNAPCASLTPAFLAAQIANTYKIGEALNVSTAPATVDVAITAVLPASVQENLAQQLALPASCQPAPGSLVPQPNSFLAGGAVKLSNGSYQLKARVGNPFAQKVLSNSQYQLLVR